MHKNTMRLIAFFMTMWFAMSGSQAWADDAQVQPAERTVIEDVGIDTLMPNESAREKNVVVIEKRPFSKAGDNRERYIRRLYAGDIARWISF